MSNFPPPFPPKGGPRGPHPGVDISMVMSRLIEHPFWGLVEKKFIRFSCNDFLPFIKARLLGDLTLLILSARIEMMITFKCEEILGSITPLVQWFSIF